MNGSKASTPTCTINSKVADMGPHNKSLSIRIVSETMNPTITVEGSGGLDDPEATTPTHLAPLGANDSAEHYEEQLALREAMYQKDIRAAEAEAKLITEIADKRRADKSAALTQQSKLMANKNRSAASKEKRNQHGRVSTKGRTGE